jgi:hypothetical protein
MPVRLLRNGPDTLETEGRNYGVYSGLGFSVPGWAQVGLDIGGAVFGDPTLGQQVAVGGAVVGKLLPSGSDPVTQARTAQANVYLAGALAGIVDSARLLLGTSQQNKPKNALQPLRDAIARVQTTRLDVWEAAVEAGPLSDVSYPGSTAGDGYKGLLLLLQNGIGVNFPGMGTDDGRIVSAATQGVVAQLRALAANPKTLPTGNITPGALVKPGEIAGQSTGLDAAKSVLGNPMVVMIVAGAALWFLLPPHKKG